MASVVALPTELFLIGNNAGSIIGPGLLATLLIREKSDTLDGPYGDL